MRATIQELSPNQYVPAIQIIYNQMEPVYVEPHLATKKYKKVSKAARARLLKCIEKGWTIINVSKKFGINYSTAKSIVQNQKKKTFKNDQKNSSTESFSIEEEALVL